MAKKVNFYFSWNLIKFSENKICFADPNKFYPTGWNEHFQYSMKFFRLWQNWFEFGIWYSTNDSHFLELKFILLNSHFLFTSYLIDALILNLEHSNIFRSKCMFILKWNVPFHKAKLYLLLMIAWQRQSFISHRNELTGLIVLDQIGTERPHNDLRS